jgi:diguanylate cyclase (GGDEF)-like protein
LAPLAVAVVAGALVAATAILLTAAAVTPLSARFVHTTMATAVLFVSLLAVALRVRDERGSLRIAWLCLAGVLVTWFLADSYRTAPLHHILRMAGYAAFIASLPVLATPRKRSPNQRWVLDALIVTVVAGIFCFETLLRPLTDAVGQTHAIALVALSYPLLDVALAAALIMSLYGGAPRKRTACLSLVVGARMISDFAHLYATAFFDVDPIASGLDLGWIASLAFIGAAAIVRDQPDPYQQTSERPPTLWGFLATYCAVVLLATVTIAASLWGPPPPALVIGAGVAISLAAVRQAAIGFEHLRIHRDLQHALAYERHAARIDPLTGVLNHGAITAAIAEAIAVAGQDTFGHRVTPREIATTHAIVMIDVDDLKATNDTFGHQAGDDLLRTVSEALKRNGAVAGRYAGDEFAVLLPGASRADGEAYVRDVTLALEQAHLHDEATAAHVRVRASIGFAIFPTEAETVADLLRLADSAMYADKRSRTELDVPSTDHRRRDERAAQLVADLIPLIASPGDVQTKLTHIGQRLSTACGYDAVRVAIFGPPLITSLVTDAGERNDLTAHPAMLEQPVRGILEATHRPVIIDDMTGDDRFSPELRAALAVAGMRSALAVPMLRHDEVIGSIGAVRRTAAAFSARDAQLLGTIAGQITAIVTMAGLVQSLQETSTRLEAAQAETVMMLAAVAEAHDRTTGLHLVSIRKLTEALAIELGYSNARARELGLAAVLHDIGKVSVPEGVLSSTGRLAGDQWDLLKQHTIWGQEVLVGRQGFELAAVVARAHHERWDGTGYPDGLSAGDIPEEATIVAVADSFDAMTDDRPYRAGLSPHQALAEIVANRGAQFNPRVVDALLRLADRGLLGDAVSVGRKAA